MPTTEKTSLIDYAALAAAVRERQELEGLELKQIAAQSGVEKSKLSNLVNLKSGLSTDNLMLVCDWLGTSLYDYRLPDVPRWLIDRIAAANNLSPETAERMAAERASVAFRQAASARAFRQLDTPALLAEAQRSTARR